MDYNVSKRPYLLVGNVPDHLHILAPKFDAILSRLQQKHGPIG